MLIEAFSSISLVITVTAQAHRQFSLLRWGRNQHAIGQVNIRTIRVALLCSFFVGLGRQNCSRRHVLYSTQGSCDQCPLRVWERAAQIHYTSVIWSYATPCYNARLLMNSELDVCGLRNAAPPIPHPPLDEAALRPAALHPRRLSTSSCPTHRCNLSL